MLLNQTRAVATIESAGLEALVATSPDNVMYASDYDCLTHWINKGAQVFALLSPGADPAATLVAPMLEVESIVSSDVWIRDILLVGDFSRNYQFPEALDSTAEETRRIITTSDRFETAIQALVHAVKARGLDRSRIGLDESGLTPQAWAHIVASLPEADIVPANSIWWTIRMVKTQEELNRLREAAQITERSVSNALTLVHPGVNDFDVIDRYHMELTRQGARHAFTCFGSGPRSARPHISEGRREIEHGDVIRYDLGCTYRHYYSDLARTFVLGEPTSFQQKVWEAIVQGEEEAIALVRPGAEPADLFAATMKPGIEAGLEGYSRVHCGHGVGITVYDPPLLMPESLGSNVYLMPLAEGGLEENMVINVETALYVQGVGGFQCEDTMVVTANGAELLSNRPKHLRFEDAMADVVHSSN